MYQNVYSDNRMQKHIQVEFIMNTSCILQLAEWDRATFLFYFFSFKPNILLSSGIFKFWKY
jgi:hypothetical protein